jgi:hypothetical protein|tara:strand:+ start:4119 stop:4361 length:243 start_codon:yes stop_codon:yes gene_type:complete
MENEVNPEEELKRLHAMYANFAQNAVGQIVLDDLKKRFHFNSTTVKTGTIDPHELAYAEGQRSVVLFLIAMGEIGKQAEN